MRFPRFVAAAAVALTLCLGQGAFAQDDTDTQTFTVVVGDAVDISAPSDVSITHNLADSNQVFNEQVWNVFTTNASGAVVNMSMGRFINQANASFFRDASMALAVLSSDSTATWTIDTANDSTAGSGTASVGASSTGPGVGTLGLTVEFIETDASTLASGDYVSVVTGTITNN